MAQEKKNKNTNNMPSKYSKWLIFITLILLVGQFILFNQFEPKETTWKVFKNEMLAKNDVERISVLNKEEAEIFIKEEKRGEENHQAIIKENPGPHYVFQIGSVESFEQKLASAKEELHLKELPDITYKTETNWWPVLLSWLLPVIILVAVWVFVLRAMGSGRPGGMRGGSAFDFGKSKAKMFDANNKSSVTFKDVAGLEEAKTEIMEIVDFLKKPAKYVKLGAKIPKGVMIVGSPGTGKTLLAKAVAGEAQVPFFSMSGSEFVEMFVGVGASRVRDLFKKAKAKAPSIIFIDEIDAVGRSRGNAFAMQSNDERESTLNQLLTEMDGFENNKGVIVMAATNRPDILDKALLRPGRFDRHIYLELPTLQERIAIFGVHIRNLSLGDDINLDFLAHQTPGFSGADIANICNEAALIAARKHKEVVEQEDFMEAIDRIVGGIERKGKIISKEEKKIIAYHEAGHATASWFLPSADELLKVTIVPRGKSLGSAWYLPEEHQLITESQFMDKLCMALGGRAAEEVIFGEVSSGALDDLEKVTKLAYTMVAYYGFNEKLGNVSYFDSSGQYEKSLQKPYSESTAKVLDDEVLKLIKAAYEKTKFILIEHKSELEKVAKLLLEKEIIFKEDLEKIFGKRNQKSDRSLRSMSEVTD